MALELYLVVSFANDHRQDAGSGQRHGERGHDDWVEIQDSKIQKDVPH